MNETHTELIIYTDAAYNLNKKGAIAVIRGQEEFAQTYSNCPSAACLEIEAIVRAIENYKGEEGLQIRTDSKAVIQRIKNILSPETLVKMHQINCSHPNIKVELEWVPAYQGNHKQRAS